MDRTPLAAKEHQNLAAVWDKLIAPQDVPCIRQEQQVA
jgi:hypothetical protein